MSFWRNLGEALFDSAAATGSKLAAEEHSESAYHNAEAFAQHLHNRNYGQASWEFIKGVGNQAMADLHKENVEDIYRKWRL